MLFSSTSMMVTSGMGITSAEGVFKALVSVKLVFRVALTVLIVAFHILLF